MAKKKQSPKESQIKITPLEPLTAPEGAERFTIIINSADSEKFPLGLVRNLNGTNYKVTAVMYYHEGFVTVEFVRAK